MESLRATAEHNLETVAKRILRGELARSGVTYKVLAKRLAAMGILESHTAIANRVSRGRFTFVFFLQCMSALGVNQVHIDLSDMQKQSLTDVGSESQSDS